MSTTARDTSSSSSVNASEEELTTEDGGVIISAQKKKQALRKEIRSKLRQLDDDTLIEQSHKVWDRLYEIPAYQRASSIGLFLSMPRGEINTDAILGHAMKHNKRIYVPEVGANFENADMEMILCQDHGGMENFHKRWPTNRWNIPEPPPEMERVIARPGDIDVLVVPGLAFDAYGGRLGQGKGYYDRFIARHRHCSFSSASGSGDGGVGGSEEGAGEEEERDSINKAQKPILIAVCLRPQFLQEPRRIPMSEHDYPMDMILLPDKTINIKKNFKRELYGYLINMVMRFLKKCGNVKEFLEKTKEFEKQE